MKKITLIGFLLISFLPAFGASTVLTLPDSTYDLEFKNIARIEAIVFEETKNMTVESGPLKASLSKDTILLKGNEPGTVIRQLTLPAGSSFTLHRPEGRIWFKNGEYKIETEDGHNIIEKSASGLYIRNDGNVVKVSSKGVFITSDDEKVDISGEGIVIKEDGEEVRLGLLGKLISLITRKAVSRSLESAFRETDILRSSLNDLLAEKVPDFTIIKGDNGIHISTSRDSDEDAIPTVETYYYKTVEEIDLSMASSSVVFLPSKGDQVKVTVIKKAVPETGYKIVMNQKGKTLEISEQISRSVKRLSVKFILEVPSMKKITVKGLSSGINVSRVESASLSLETLSGNISLFELKGRELNLKNTSGDIYIKDIRYPEKMSLSTISGDIKISDMKTDELTLKTTSGDVKGELITMEEARFTTVSGDFYFRKTSAGSVEFRSTSGDISGEDCSFKRFHGNSVSGDATFRGSRIDEKSFSSVSGDLIVSLLKTNQTQEDVKA